MRYLTILILICFGIPLREFSCECNGITDDSEREDAFGNQKQICYEIGGDRSTFTIIITDDELLCDVLIQDTFKGWRTTTTCEKTAILDWAFNNLDKELVNIKYKIDNEYSPIFYTLSLIVDGEKKFVTSERRQITGNRKLAKKIKQLGTFILTIFYNELEQSYP